MGQWQWEGEAEGKEENAWGGHMSSKLRCWPTSG